MLKYSSTLYDISRKLLFYKQVINELKIKITDDKMRLYNTYIIAQ